MFAKSTIYFVIVLLASIQLIAYAAQNSNSASVMVPQGVMPIAGKGSRTLPHYFVGLMPMKSDTELLHILKPQYYDTEYADGVALTLGDGLSYYCHIPSPNPSISTPPPTSSLVPILSPESTPSTSTLSPTVSPPNVRAGEVLVGFSLKETVNRVRSTLGERCLTYTRDYWSYSVCPFKKVTQFHYEGNDQTAITTQFSLGTFTHTSGYDDPTTLRRRGITLNKLNDITDMPTQDDHDDDESDKVDTSSAEYAANQRKLASENAEHRANHRYSLTIKPVLTQVFEGGSDGRTTEVRYFCPDTVQSFLRETTTGRTESGTSDARSINPFILFTQNTKVSGVNRDNLLGNVDWIGSRQEERPSSVTVASLNDGDDDNTSDTQEGRFVNSNPMTAIGTANRAVDPYLPPHAKIAAQQAILKRPPALSSSSTFSPRNIAPHFIWEIHELKLRTYIISVATIAVCPAWVSKAEAANNKKLRPISNQNNIGTFPLVSTTQLPLLHESLGTIALNERMMSRLRKALVDPDYTLAHRLMQNLRGTCINHNAGWWIYSVCVGDRIEQFHLDQIRTPIEGGGNSPKRSAQGKNTASGISSSGKKGEGVGIRHGEHRIVTVRTSEYSLGFYDHIATLRDIDFSTFTSDNDKSSSSSSSSPSQDWKNHNENIKDSFHPINRLRMPHTAYHGPVVYDIVQGSDWRSTYLRQRFTHGTACDVTQGKSRESQVKYYCEPKAKRPIVLSVDEVSSCTYDISVGVSQICEHRLFKPTRLKVHEIICTPYQPRRAFPSYNPLRSPLGNPRLSTSLKAGYLTNRNQAAHILNYPVRQPPLRTPSLSFSSTLLSSAKGKTLTPDALSSPLRGLVLDSLD